jgi:hypothetical protein
MEATFKRLDGDRAVEGRVSRSPPVDVAPRTADAFIMNS